MADALMERLEAADRGRVVSENARDVCIVVCLLGSVLLGSAGFRLWELGGYGGVARVLGHSAWICFVLGLMASIACGLWVSRRARALPEALMELAEVCAGGVGLDLGVDPGDRIGALVCRLDGYAMVLERGIAEVWMRAARLGGFVLWLIALAGTGWLAWLIYSGGMGGVTWKTVAGSVLDAGSLGAGLWVLCWGVPASVRIDHEGERIVVRTVRGFGAVRQAVIEFGDLTAVELRKRFLQRHDRELVLRLADGSCVVAARFRGARGNSEFIRNTTVDDAFALLCEVRRRRVEWAVVGA